MAGSYRERGNSYELKYTHKGKSYYKTIKKDKDIKVSDELSRFVISIQDKINPTSSIPFNKYCDKWMKEYAIPQLSEKTVQNYDSYLELRIKPFFGTDKLKDITTYRVQIFLNDLAKEHKIVESNNKNKKNKIEQLSTESIKRYKALLSVMFSTAVKWQLINFNPCTYVDLPKGRKSEFRVVFLNKEEAQKLLDCLNSETELKYKVIVRLALQCGMRRSEIVGLSWSDIDFNNCTISIDKTLSYLQGQGQVIADTKTEKSIRTINVKKYLIELINQLPKTSDLIFNREHIDNVTKWFNRFLTRHNLKHMRFHDLRHSHATLLISNGINAKVVSSRLGHSTITTTLNLYTHALNEDDKKASEII